MMIDYDKLKLAHKLAENLDGYYFKIVCGITHEFMFELFDANQGMGRDDSFVCHLGNSIDNVIAKLTEPTQPVSKYEIGQKVWFINTENRMTEDEINEIDLASDEQYFIENEDWWFKEESLHETKAALIEAQIEYWNNLKQQHLFEESNDIRFDVPKRYVAGFLPKECQHESDGMVYCSIPPQNKCLKCGEFYK